MSHLMDFQKLQVPDVLMVSLGLARKLHNVIMVYLGGLMVSLGLAPKG